MTGLAIAMAATAIAVLAAIVGIARTAARRAGVGVTRVTATVAAALAGWLTVTGGLAASGVLRLDGGPPRVLLLPIIAIAAAGTALRSSTGRLLVAAAPRGAVVALQSFRVAVELVLWRLYVAGAIPIQMTFEGRNLDIVVGLTAVPIALAARRYKRLALAWHVAGLLLLVNIVAIAIMSTPGPLQVFTAEPANRIIGTFPFVWLPAVLVPVAALGHLVGLRQIVER